MRSIKLLRVFNLIGIWFLERLLQNKRPHKSDYGDKSIKGVCHGYQTWQKLLENIIP